MSIREPEVFIVRSKSEPIDRALSALDLPTGISIRRIHDWQKDLERASRLGIAAGDSVPPHFYMIPPESPGLTLLMAYENEIIGQASADLQDKTTNMANVDVWLGGIFISSDHRGKGYSKSLGSALIDIAEAWRRDIAKSLGLSAKGAVVVDADTEPGSASEALMLYMHDRGIEYDEIAYDEAEGLVPEPSLQMA